MAFNIGRVERHEQECIIRSQRAEIAMLKRQLAVAKQNATDGSVNNTFDNPSSNGNDAFTKFGRSGGSGKSDASELFFKETNKVSETHSPLFQRGKSMLRPIEEHDKSIGNISSTKGINSKAYKVVHSETLTGHNEAVLCCQYSPDGNFLASGSADSTLRIWDLKPWQDYLHIRGAQLSAEERG